MRKRDMARNSEKRLSGLNRFLEAKEAEKNSELQRPPLVVCGEPALKFYLPQDSERLIFGDFRSWHRLASADEIKGWIPSIQKEINYLLMQVEGTGSRKHQDSKIKEFQERIEYLQREHRRFVTKVRSLDPSYRDVVPWQPRAYSRKRRRERDGGGEEGMMTQTKRLFSPLLGEKTGVKPVQDPDSQLDDFPFGARTRENTAHDTQTYMWKQSGTVASSSGVTACSRVQVSAHNPGTTVNSTSLETPSSKVDMLVGKSSKVTSPLELSRGLLGLDYSSSSEDESTH